MIFCKRTGSIDITCSHGTVVAYCRCYKHDCRPTFSQMAQVKNKTNPRIDQLICRKWRRKKRTPAHDDHPSDIKRKTKIIDHTHNIITDDRSVLLPEHCVRLTWQ